MTRRLRRLTTRAGCFTLGLPCGCALLLLGCLLTLPLLLVDPVAGSAASGGWTLTGSGTGTSGSGGPAGRAVEAGFRPLFSWTPASGFPTGTWPYGQCTWFVVFEGHAAGTHQVTWSGNAADWYVNAQAAGVATAPPSTAPQPGWVAVFARDHGSSGVGHVAVVVGIQPAAGTYTIAEMNVLGLGVMDLRSLSLNGTNPELEGWIP